MKTIVTIEDFKHEMYKLYPQDKDPEPREWVVHTGQGGMTLFNEAMKKEVRLRNAHDNINMLRDEKKITDQEWSNLKGMILSPDLENLTVVESIIEHYNGTI